MSLPEASHGLVKYGKEGEREVDFLQFVGRGEAGGDAAPAITPDGEIGFAPDESIVLNTAWSAIRVHRGDVSREPAVMFEAGGSLVLTARRLIWIAHSISAGAGRRTGYGMTALTGSLAAGALAQGARRRMFDRRINREGVIAGHVPEEWIQYIGFFEPDNFLRIGVVDEFTDMPEPVYIDLVQPADSPVRATAELLLRTLRDRRLDDSTLPPRVRAQLPAVGFPTGTDPALLVSTELPGWTTTGESRAQRYSLDRRSPMTPAPARATTSGSGLPVPQSATDTEGSRSESIIWTGTACVVADEARAARGREVFSLSAPPLQDVQIAVTSERLVYWTRLEGTPDWLEPEYRQAPGSHPFACGEGLHRYPGSVIEREAAELGLPPGPCLTTPSAGSCYLRGHVAYWRGGESSGLARNGCPTLICSDWGASRLGDQAVGLPVS